MREQLRYVEARRNRDGRTRYYWRRKGHGTVRLPDDRAARIRMADKLNAAADDDDDAVLLDGSIGWVVAKYEASAEYQRLAEGTKKYYRKYLAEIVQRMGSRREFSAVSRRIVVDLVEDYPESERRKISAVLRNLFNTAMYHGHAATNHAAKLRLPETARRDEWWREDQASAWLAAAPQHPKGEALALAFQLMRYTAQRPADCLLMAWGQYNGDTVLLRQAKTKKLLEVPCHRDLRAALADARPAASSPLIVAHRGRPMTYPKLLEGFSQVCAIAGIAGLQMRDLRRTAVICMSQAGATEGQIASVTGHSIENTRQILEHYLPRHVSLAREAVTKWEDR